MLRKNRYDKYDMIITVLLTLFRVEFYYNIASMLLMYSNRFKNTMKKMVKITDDYKYLPQTSTKHNSVNNRILVYASRGLISNL